MVLFLPTHQKNPARRHSGKFNPHETRMRKFIEYLGGMQSNIFHSNQFVGGRTEKYNAFQLVYDLTIICYLDKNLTYYRQSIENFGNILTIERCSR